MKKIYFALTLIFLLSSCEKDEIISPTPEQGQQQPVIELLNFKDVYPEIFNGSDLTSSSLSKITGPFGPIDESVHVKKITDKKGKSSYTFLLKKLDTKSSHQTPKGYYFDNLVIREGKKVKTLIFRYTPTQEWLTGVKDYEKFSGKITIFNLRGEVLSNINSSGGVQENIPAQEGRTVCSYELERVETWCFGDLCTTIYYYKETCTSGDPFDPSGGGCIGEDCGPSDPESIPTTPTEGDPDWDSGGGGGDDTTTSEVTVKVERDSSFIENDKINCTYEQLVKESSIPEILQDFFGDDALFDVIFYVVENLNCNGSTDASGCTTPLPGDAYRIDIDLGYINDPSTPTIFLAQTLVHEAIHANLFAAVKKLNNGVTPSDTGFEALYEDYRQHQGWQHEFMADHYTGIMQEAIWEVHSNLNDNQFLDSYDNNTLWDWNEFYEYVSYRGLKDTEAGSDYFGDSANNISLYKEDAETLSTKQPNCDE